MNEAELTEALEEAGFSPYEASAYVSLLELGSAAATEVADRSGVPGPRIYDVLRDLEQAGYIETYEQDTYRARIHDFEALQSTLEQRATQFSAAVEEVERRWRASATDTPRERSLVSFVTRFETVLEAATEAIEGADKQVLVAASPATYRRLRPALGTATARDASVYLSVFTDGDGVSAQDTGDGESTQETEDTESTQETEDTESALDTGEGESDRDAGNGEPLPDAEDVAAVCTEARHRHLSSPFVAVVDRMTVCFAPHPESSNEYGLIVDDRTHASVFHWYFLTTQWDIWEPFYAPEDDAGEYLDIRYCVRDVEPLVDSGATVRLRVEGFDTRSGSPVTIVGTVCGVEVDPDVERWESPPVASYGGRVALVLETDSGTVEVGGWGALVEDVEAHRLRVLSVE